MHSDLVVVGERVVVEEVVVLCDAVEHVLARVLAPVVGAHVALAKLDPGLVDAPGAGKVGEEGLGVGQGVGGVGDGVGAEGGQGELEARALVHGDGAAAVLAVGAAVAANSARGVLARAAAGDVLSLGALEVLVDLVAGHKVVDLAGDLFLDVALVRFDLAVIAVIDQLLVFLGCRSEDRDLDVDEVLLDAVGWQRPLAILELLEGGVRTGAGGPFTTPLVTLQKLSFSTHSSPSQVRRFLSSLG